MCKASLLGWFLCKYLFFVVQNKNCSINLIFIQIFCTSWCNRIHTCTRTCTRMHARIHALTLTFTRTHVYAHTHTHTYTHTHKTHAKQYSVLDSASKYGHDHVVTHDHVHWTMVQIFIQWMRYKRVFTRRVYDIRTTSSMLLRSLHVHMLRPDCKPGPLYSQRTGYKAGWPDY